MSHSFSTVKTAATFLDEKIPGWHRKVNVEILCQGSQNQCVLAQLFSQEYHIAANGFASPYDYGMAKLDIEFCKPFGSRTTTEWRDEINNRHIQEAARNLPPIHLITGEKQSYESLREEITVKAKKIEMIESFERDILSYQEEIKRNQSYIEKSRETIKLLKEELGVTE